MSRPESNGGFLLMRCQKRITAGVHRATSGTRVHRAPAGLVITSTDLRFYALDFTVPESFAPSLKKARVTKGHAPPPSRNGGLLQMLLVVFLSIAGVYRAPAGLGISLHVAWFRMTSLFKIGKAGPASNVPPRSRTGFSCLCCGNGIMYSHSDLPALKKKEILAT
ncbi:hypothetical protein B0H17DRAFT_1142037 [Mycena rosella]|uniref:Uncharacterized protein n=1 Tax=Mycena rosella TaxID=1033263 RepID=A0AAD7CYN4_MYCRO|nr:hypothetical protein B0H17DRAFT_1142037 [Mycena rosella]